MSELKCSTCGKGCCKSSKGGGYRHLVRPKDNHKPVITEATIAAKRTAEKQRCEAKLKELGLDKVTGNANWDKESKSAEWQAFLSPSIPLVNPDSVQEREPIDLILDACDAIDAAIKACGTKARQIRARRLMKMHLDDGE